MNAELVEVRFASGRDSRLRMSMVFILPDESMKFSFGEWLSSENFTWANVAAALLPWNEQTIDLSFPEFKIDARPSVKDILKDLGMRRAFNEDEADFSEILSFSLFKKKLFIGDVVHGAAVGTLVLLR